MVPPDAPSGLRAEYAARFNRVVDHVQAHLGEPMDLETLARVACFSPFHFHRLFRSWMGETLQQFIQRLRLERAAWLLSYRPEASVTEIALPCGFSSSAAFARAFREHHGCTASAWRKRKLGQAEGKQGKDSAMPGTAPWEAAGSSPRAMEPPMTKLLLDVQVRDLPARTLAYLRHVGPYKGDAALFGRLFERLCAWAGPRGLIGPDTAFLSLYHDSPDITPSEKLRLEVALEVPAGTPVSGEIGRMELAAGRHAVARVEIDPKDYEEAWRQFMAEWLPGSGYQPADGPCLELYRPDATSHPDGRHRVELCLPVKRL